MVKKEEKNMSRKEKHSEPEKKHSKRKMKKRAYDHSVGTKRIILLPLLALLLAFVVESFSRTSPLRVLDYIVTHPLLFLYNALIILTTLSFSELFRRRRSVLFATSMAWCGLGVAAYLVVKERTQPLTSMDILMVKDAITLTTKYYTWTEIIFMFAAILAAIIVLIWTVARLPMRRHVNYALSLSIFAGLLTVCVCLCTLGVSFGVFPRYYDNLVDAYDRFGFATCFTFTFGNAGISEPDDYSGETVGNIVSEIDVVESPEPSPTPGPHTFGEEDNLSQPNIIFVQLESFFDVNTIIGAEYDSEPTPNFAKLLKEWPTGELYVPSIGGGTVNVEFEVLTGCNIDFFTAGEYPYTTLLSDTTSESIAYNLRELGYSTTAMHDHTGTFYNRYKVYGNLGFDHFVPLEYMPYVTYTEVGWAQDIVMANEIVKALNASEERDFVMAVTVESHGKYEDEYTYTEGDVQVLSLPEQISLPRFSNYLHLIQDADRFIGELIDKLSYYDEPVVVVFYGDHLPGLDLTADILTTNNLYASRYVIWNNFGADFEAPDLQAYRLNANLLKQLGISGGVVCKYNQSYPVDTDDPEYLENLELLQYDVLYGDRSVYGGESPYQPIEIQQGTLPVEITGASNRYGRLLVNGTNFTEYSTILIDDAAYPTAFISSTQVIAIVSRETPVNEICVAQITEDGTELGRSSIFRMD